MGVCHSGCRAPPPELEYYDAWRHRASRARTRAKERVRQAARGSRGSVRARIENDTVVARSKVWACPDGCCSIRWKLSYEGTLAFKAYADMSPYVVTVDADRMCRCVICEGHSPVQMRRKEASAWCRVDRLSRSEASKSKASVSSGESLTDDEDPLL